MYISPKYRTFGARKGTMSKNEVRNILLSKLKAENCFWSYSSDSWDSATDEQLIEKTLIYLDLPEINQLFTLYGRKKVKQVWLHRMVSQGAYLSTLNRFLAWYYFGVKNPDVYLKSQETRYWNRLASC